MRRAAGSISVLTGLGFGLPCLFGVLYLAQTGEVWAFLGFPTYGSGPFERIGLDTTVPLLLGFLIVCIAEIVIGVMLWYDAPLAAALSYALLPAELAFWIGFALPVGPMLGLARSGLLVIASV